MNTITALQIATLALRHIAKGRDDQQNTITAREALRDIDRLVPHSPPQAPRRANLDGG